MRQDFTSEEKILIFKFRISVQLPCASPGSSPWGKATGQCLVLGSKLTNLLHLQLLFWLEVLENHHFLQFLPLPQQMTAIEREVKGDTYTRLGLGCPQVTVLVPLVCRGNAAQTAAVPLSWLPRGHF